MLEVHRPVGSRLRLDLEAAGLAVALLIFVILGSGLRPNRRRGAARPFRRRPPPFSWPATQGRSPGHLH